MPKVAEPRSALWVKRMDQPGRWPVGTVPGLMLQVTESGARSWVMRVRVGDRRREIGLGGYPAVPLAAAHEKARAIRDSVAAGVDPVTERRRVASELKATMACQRTFRQCAEACVAARAKGFRNSKHAAQWSSTLETYAHPRLGDLVVSDVATAHVLGALEPIWAEKPETASRVRGRIEAVLDWATARGYRSGENPARWRGHLDALLAKPAQLKKVRHHRALPFRDMRQFMTRLRQQQGIAAKALEFTILAAARSGEVRGATWAEIDLARALWTIPAARMKAGREHIVPLPEPAIALLKGLDGRKGLLFPSGERPLSDMALLEVLRRMEVPAVPHGFRSTFRDWAGETTAHPREVIEHALAHQIPDKAEAAYARGTLLDKRRALMTDWSKYCAQEATAHG